MAKGEHARGWWIAFGAIAASALVLSFLAYTGRLLPQFFEADKAVHFTIAGLLASTLDRATGSRSLKWVFALLVVFGADEIAQRLSVNRSSSIADYAADVAGVAVFTLAVRRISKPRRANAADDVSE